MKLFILFLVIAASSAQARQFKCSEKATDALAKNRVQYSVLVTTLSEITNPILKGDYDHVTNVRVSILSREPRTGSGPFRLDRPSFEAIAKSEDVNYNIRSPKHGFSFGVYLDEMDQSWMKLTGVRGDIRLNCH